MFRVHAYNASGDTLFFTADADGADHLEDLTASQAYDVMATRKTGHRWNDDTQRFTRNRIAYFRLVHATGHAERITPAEAAAVVNAPKPAPLAPVDCFGRPALVVAVDCFGRPALVVAVADRTYTVTGVDEFGAIRTAEHGTVNPGAVAELDAAVYASGLWAFARKPRVVPYANGLHEFAPTSGGTTCVTPCLRPDGTVQPCGDPVKGAIHDPQAYAAYATELAAELAKWVAAPAALMPCPRNCGADVRKHHSSDSVNGGCDTGPMPVADMRDWFAARGVGQLGYPMADAIAEHYGKTEDELNEVYDAMHGPIA